MARKGSHKVRTGCLTCKARKVKCDESKPHCNRCIATGRLCSGYLTKVSSGLLWQRPRQLFQSIDKPSEGRALQYFCEKTAQFLSGATDPYFWTHLVMQFCNFEPAVNHSVIAISSLYEQMEDGDGRSHSGVQLRDNSLALQHYNAAIRELKTTDNQPLVLLVCILFICIEFLQSNKDAAIKHCKHGIALLDRADYSWAKEHLLPVFRRLSSFPFLLGAGPFDFPDLASLDSSLPTSFNSFDDAASVLDFLQSRTLRVVRLGDPYRVGKLRYKTVPSDLLEEQEAVACLLDQWHILFESLDSGSTLPVTPATEIYNLGMDFIGLMSRAILLIRYELSRVTLNTAFKADEICYDQYLKNFQRALDACALIDSVVPEEARDPSRKREPQFIFETGFTVWLHLIATRCRDLAMRLEALRLMGLLGVPRENLWELRQMHALARRVIEIEHGTILDDDGRPATPVQYPGLPPDERRVRHTNMEPKPSVYIDLNGKEVCGWSVGFVMRDEKDAIVTRTEFIIAP
ncbi:uncharacterized protein F4812DRAFT_451330 [Daldinia caldariorum]|uniref:uncharacterized protein n=1 Tax=Daldinia caldariorum TaxID=326644 RepID=UPI0020084E62|nr:uncharacterized protein F4812DRAFT_451330 [Daldinia caldariorum]KAI1467606.1 hypothetical protein F4812DRAFT_451330 [Daldinia caldariorum]